MSHSAGAHDPSVAEDGDTSPRAERVGRSHEGRVVAIVIALGVALIHAPFLIGVMR